MELEIASLIACFIVAPQAQPFITTAINDALISPQNSLIDCSWPCPNRAMALLLPVMALSVLAEVMVAG
jgi:hypothetical protein